MKAGGEDERSKDGSAGAEGGVGDKEAKEGGEKSAGEKEKGGR